MTEDERTPEATAPAPQDLGGKVQEMIASTPEIMRELMQQFVERKDLNDRVRIRLRMKSLLDLVSVDTVYPKKTASMTRPDPYGAGPRPYVPAQPAGFGDVAPGLPPDPVEVPGAAGNDDILGG